MSDSQDETKVQPAVGADGRPRPGSAGQRSQGSNGQGSNGQGSNGAAARKTSASGQQRPTSGASSRSTSTSSASTRTSGQGSGGGRTLTAADYARTTRGAADQTSVIPAIADSGASSSSTATASSGGGTGRQARLRLNHVEPWSVTRIAFIVSVALMIVSTVAVAIFWIVLDVVGVWDQLNSSVSNVLADDSNGFDFTDYLGLGRLTGLTLLLSAINVLVFTAVATIGAHLYNLAAQLLGGIQVTFSDD